MSFKIKNNRLLVRVDFTKRLHKESVNMVYIQAWVIQNYKI